MEKKSLKLITTTGASMIANVVAFFVAMTISALIPQDQKVLVTISEIIGYVVLYAWPVVSFILAVISFVIAVRAKLWKNSKTFTYFIAACFELPISIVGPAVFAVMCYLGSIGH